MNDRGIRYKTDPYVVGKGFVITVVVIFSAVSFTLGYFVGKKNDRTISRPSLRKGEIVLSERNAVVPSTADASSPERERDKTVQPGGTKETGTGKPEQPETGSRAAEMPQPAVSATKTGAAAPAADGPDNRSAVPREKPGRKGSAVYTVQLGAFRNPADAERFRAEFEKKGYETYISASQNANNETIHKIRVGEFRERKDAEILSLKLKKLEGLNTFVTFKN